LLDLGNNVDDLVREVLSFWSLLDFSFFLIWIHLFTCLFVCL
jgi:hypothetical protein